MARRRTSPSLIIACSTAPPHRCRHCAHGYCAAVRRLFLNVPVLCVVTALMGCAAEQSANSEPSGAPPTSLAPVSASVSVTVTAVVSTPPPTAPPTSAAAPSAATTEISAPNRRVGVWEDGVAAANEFAEAFVARDWKSVRGISPTNSYTDAELAEGYDGLVDQELVLAGRRAIDSTTVALYFMLFADEERPSPQTSVYCVRWDYRSDTHTIAQQLGVLLDRSNGFSRDALGAAWTCDGLEASSAIDQSTVSHGSQMIGSEIDDPGVIEFEGGTFECEPPAHLLGVARSCRHLDAGEAGDAEPQLLCWASGEYWDCTDEGYYPGDLEGYDVATINGQRALCQQESGDCWVWDAEELPTEAVFFDIDYRCINNLCEPA